MDLKSRKVTRFLDLFGIEKEDQKKESKVQTHGDQGDSLAVMKLSGLLLIFALCLVSTEGIRIKKNERTTDAFNKKKKLEYAIKAHHEGRLTLAEILAKGRRELSEQMLRTKRERGKKNSEDWENLPKTMNAVSAADRLPPPPPPPPRGAWGAQNVGDQKENPSIHSHSDTKSRSVSGKTTNQLSEQQLKQAALMQHEVKQNEVQEKTTLMATKRTPAAPKQSAAIEKEGDATGLGLRVSRRMATPFARNDSRHVRFSVHSPVYIPKTMYP